MRTRGASGEARSRVAEQAAVAAGGEEVGHTVARRSGTATGLGESMPLALRHHLRRGTRFALARARHVFVLLSRWRVTDGQLSMDGAHVPAPD